MKPNTELSPARAKLAARQEGMDLSTAEADIDSYIIAVLLKEHADVLARRRVARDAFIAVEAEAIALTELFGEHGRAGPGANINYKVDWLRAGERAAAALREQGGPQVPISWVTAALQRWSQTLQRLVTDATAR